MEQHDGAGMDAAEKLLISFLVGWLIVLVPVHIGQAPEEGLIAERLGHFQVGFAVFALGRAVVFLHRLAGGLLVNLFQTGQFL